MPQTPPEPRMSLLRRAGSSLAGHIALAQIGWSLPMAALFLYLNYKQGALTFEWALWIVFISSVLGLAWAIVMWYVATLPRLRKRSNNRWRGP